MEANDTEDDDLLNDGDKNADGSDKEMEDAEQTNPNAENKNDAKSDKAPAASQQMPPQKQAALLDKALDRACEQLINEISIKVMLESDDGTARKELSPLSVEELTTYNNMVNSVNNSSPVVLPSTPILDDVTRSCCSTNDKVISLSGLGGSTLPPASQTGAPSASTSAGITTASAGENAPAICSRAGINSLATDDVGVLLLAPGTDKGDVLLPTVTAVGGGSQGDTNSLPFEDGGMPLLAPEPEERGVLLPITSPGDNTSPDGTEVCAAAPTEAAIGSPTVEATVDS